MTFLIFAGCVALIFGIMLILFPKGLVKITEWANKAAGSIAEKALKYRIGLGICLIMSAACLWFVAYYMKVIPILKAMN